MFSLFVCFAALSADFLCGGHTSCEGINPSWGWAWHSQEEENPTLPGIKNPRASPI